MLTLNSNNNAHDQANKTNGVEARQITTQDKNEKYALNERDKIENQ